MKTKIKTIALLAAICCFLSCKDSNDKQHLFFQYIKETFNQSETIKNQVFVIIPCSGCSGCDNSVYKLFIEKFSDSGNYTLIICNPENKNLLSPLLKADNVKYDFLAKMTEYDFGYGYPSCIYVKDNKVINHLSLTPELIHFFTTYASSNNYTSYITNEPIIKFTLQNNQRIYKSAITNKIIQTL